MRKILIVIVMSIISVFLLKCNKGQGGFTGTYICQGNCYVKSLTFKSGYVSFNAFSVPYSLPFEIGDINSDDMKGKFLNFKYRDDDIFFRVEENDKKLTGMFQIFAGRVYVKSE